MANPVVLQISAELSSLQKELNQFKSLISYLNNAKQNLEFSSNVIKEYDTFVNDKAKSIKTTIQSLDSLDKSVNRLLDRVDLVNFPARLDSFEEGFVELVSIIQELKGEIDESSNKLNRQIDKIDFGKKFNELQQQVSRVVKSTEDLQLTIQLQIDSAIINLNRNSEKFANDTFTAIKNLRLPDHINKLEVNLTNLLTAFENIRRRIEGLDQIIAEKLNETTEKQIIKITSIEEKINLRIADVQKDMAILAKRQRSNAYITWVIIILGTLAISILLKF